MRYADGPMVEVETLIGAPIERVWELAEVPGLWPCASVDVKTNSVGTPEMIAERLRLSRDAGVTTLRVGLPAGDLDSRLGALVTLLDLAGTVG